MKVVLYGADWCPDCTRSKRFLEENNIEYGYMDLGIWFYGVGNLVLWTWDCDFMDLGI